ncbi:tyrosine-type recombinase/integrase [Thermodesulfobacteriota bacterium]
MKAITDLTSNNPRDHLLFLLGINNGLRTIDILKLKVKDVRNMKPGDTLTIKESKTGKDNVLMINKTVHKALRNYLDQAELNDDDYLFKSRKGNGALQSQAVSKLVKKWTSAINLKGNYGAHTLRKTFGYIQRKEYGVGFEIICKRYNHSSPAVTMRYLGIEDKEVNGILMHDIG